MVLEQKLDFAFRKFKLDQKRAARRRNFPASEEDSTSKDNGSSGSNNGGDKVGSLGMLGESLNEGSNDDFSGSSGSEDEEEGNENSVQALASPAFLQGLEGAPPASNASGDANVKQIGVGENVNGSSSSSKVGAEPALGSDEVPGSAPPGGLTNQLNTMAQPDSNGSGSSGNVGLAAAASGADAALASSSSSSSGVAEGGGAPSPNVPDPSVMQVNKESRGFAWFRIFSTAANLRTYSKYLLFLFNATPCKRPL